MQVHIKERDLVKETIQQALIGHRQLANQVFFIFITYKVFNIFP